MRKRESSMADIEDVPCQHAKACVQLYLYTDRGFIVCLGLMLVSYLHCLGTRVVVFLSRLCTQVN